MTSLAPKPKALNISPLDTPEFSAVNKLKTCSRMISSVVLRDLGQSDRVDVFDAVDEIGDELGRVSKRKREIGDKVY